MHAGEMHDALLGDVAGFVRGLLARLAALGCDVRALQMDHVCFRVATMHEYDAAKADLARRAELLSESQIGGRPIATYRLHEPLRVNDRAVALVELPAPKKTSAYATGLEHAEFVLPRDVSFAQFMQAHPHLTFDLDAIDKEINPDIRLALSERTSVKFHHAPLDEVIAYEKSLGL